MMNSCVCVNTISEKQKPENRTALKGAARRRKKKRTVVFRNWNIKELRIKQDQTFKEQKSLQNRRRCFDRNKEER